MYSIPIEELKTGDILLTSENSVTSKVVRKSTKSDFSHAILYVGNGSYIHSDANGVHSGSIRRLLFDAPENITVLRTDFSSKVIDQACVFARTKIGTEYSIKSAINAKIKLSKKENTNRQFCSRLVAQAYEHAEAPLVEDSSFCTPQEILNSNKVRKVQCKIKEATNDEINHANSENPIEKQSNITNEILSKIRAVTKKDIQTLDQVMQHLIGHPEHDKEISEIYKKSGYLDIWEHDPKVNTWRYDGRLFLNMPLPTTELIETEEFEKLGAEQRLSRFNFNLEQYFNIFKAHKLEYARLHVKLYINLIDSTLENFNAANYVLNNV